MSTGGGGRGFTLQQMAFSFNTHDARRLYCSLDLSNIKGIGLSTPFQPIDQQIITQAPHNKAEDNTVRFPLLQTSNTISWCLYLLAKNPEIQEKLYREVISMCPGDKLPSSDDIAQMPYLKAIIRETLRLEGFICVNMINKGCDSRSCRFWQ